MEKLAKAVLLAEKIYEESFDKKASDKAIKENKLIDHEQFYTMTLWEASDKAANTVGFDKRGTQPIYLLLKYTWNDALEWAKRSLK